ncbi:peptidoglycan DD-metalloendopeptidase family protein [Streptomyces sp. NPDC059247]|uniref:peptidoglycan DD-metalloendopeptidase family protein n=1 Tax=Streptomyces sp. NPDC059247 TaxID=3346790 RepID=UPI003675DF54
MSFTTAVLTLALTLPSGLLGPSPGPMGPGSGPPVSGSGPVRPGSASPVPGSGPMGPGSVWPVGPPPPPVLRGWEPPPGPYAPGHRGVDLAAGAGTPVLAPVAGTVAFAGPVGGRGVLTLTLPGTGSPPLRTTFSPVAPLVAVGDRVAPGTPVARVAPGTHCARDCLHWGLLRGERYLNPLVLVEREPSRLLPLPPLSPYGG